MLFILKLDEGYSLTIFAKNLQHSQFLIIIIVIQSDQFHLYSPPICGQTIHKASHCSSIFVAKHKNAWLSYKVGPYQ